MDQRTCLLHMRRNSLKEMERLSKWCEPGSPTVSSQVPGETFLGSVPSIQGEGGVGPSRHCCGWLPCRVVAGHSCRLLATGSLWL